MNYCCKEFKDATREGTDNEGYGSLIQTFKPGEWFVGCNLEPLKYCPWCGHALADSDWQPMIRHAP